MKAMIFAAGLGTRLGELTKHTPKCLVEVGGKPLLAHVIDRVRNAGASEVVINLHHLGDQIVRYIEQHPFGLPIHFSHEKELLNTGGGLLHARRLLEDADEILVHNGDIFSEIDLRALVTAHRTGSCVATLAVMNRESSRHLLFDDEMKLCGWATGSGRRVTTTFDTNRLPLERAFTGIQVVSPQFFLHLSRCEGSFSIIEGYLASVDRGAIVRGADIGDSYWIDAGKPETLAALRERVKG